MRCAVLCFAFASVSFGQIASRDVVASWFPVHVGDKWIYSHETRDDVGGGIYRDERLVGGSLQIARWETEETTTGLWIVPEGTLLGRTVRIIAGSPPLGYRTDSPDPGYLIRDGCLYSAEVEWDPEGHQLTPQFREELLAGHMAPDFCFPLTADKTWGAPHFMDWRTPADAKDWKVAGVPDNGTAFYVISIPPYLGSGMTAEIWFEKGVGMVREEEIHHGTVGETRTRLVRFEPAPRGAREMPR